MFFLCSKVFRSWGGRNEAEIEMRWVFVVFTFGSYVCFLKFPHFQVADLNT